MQYNYWYVCSVYSLIFVSNNRLHLLYCLSFCLFSGKCIFWGNKVFIWLVICLTFWTRGLIYFMNTGKFSPLTLQIWLLPILCFTFLNLRSFYYASYILFVCSWDLRFWIILQSMFLYFYLDIFFRPIFSITNSLAVT